MEIIEVTKELFEDNHVRILGTFESPLFVANDIGSILGIKDVKSSIRDFDETESQVHNMHTDKGNRQMSLLTEKGLYRMLYKSRQPLAKKFQNWVYHVLHDVRTKGKYELQKAIEDNKKELELRDTKIKELEAKTLVRYQPSPVIKYDNIDVNEFVGKSVVYLLHITDSDYKFGVTSDADGRINTHKQYFKKLGYDITIVNVWKCESANIMSVIEGMIKTFAKQNNILARKYELTEIITINDMINIETVVCKITDYVNNRNTTDERGYELELMKLKLEFLKEENKGKDLDNENIRLKIELAKIESKHNVLEPIQQIRINETRHENILEDNIEIDNKDLEQQIEEIVIKQNDRISDTKVWIKNNPPIYREVSTAYFKRYSAEFIGCPLSLNPFTKLIEESGFYKIRGVKHYHWLKANK